VTWDLSWFAREFVQVHAAGLSEICRARVGDDDALASVTASTAQAPGQPHRCAGGIGAPATSCQTNAQKARILDWTAAVLVPITL